MTPGTESFSRELIRTSLFHGMTPARVEELLKIAVLRTVEPGAILVEEGGLISGLHVIVKGRVEVIKQDRTPLGSIESGSFFGEISILGQTLAATATIVAAAPCTCLIIGRAILDEWLGEDFETQSIFFRNLAAELALRLSETTEKLNQAREVKK